MKYLPVIVTICFVLLSACFNNENKFEDEGLITGPDLRLCACCGGWFIDIDTTTYLFRELPENSNIDLSSESFPLPVDLTWKPAEPTCIENLIVIQRIRKQ